MRTSSLASALGVTTTVAAPVLVRSPRWLRIVALLSTAGTAGLSMAHALERPAKLRMTPTEWWTLTTRLYRPWFGRAGHAEGVALLALPALAMTDRGARVSALLASTLLVLANPVVFVIMVAPANRATLASPDEPPDGVERLRTRWENGHLLRFCCHAGAFGALAWHVSAGGSTRPTVLRPRSARASRGWTVVPR